MKMLEAMFSARYFVFLLAVGGGAMLAVFAVIGGGLTWALAVALALTALGVHDIVQTRHSLLRNYPIVGHVRFILEELRGVVRQYFLEGDDENVPFSRNNRSVVYQRAKEELDKRPFGTKLDVYAPAFEWLNHSIVPKLPAPQPDRVMVGGADCSCPYSASRLNISAMSFGALGANAIRALNRGARMGGFAHDTGEGGCSVHHLEEGGDLIWEIGSGYFGCRAPDGRFSPERFAERAALEQIRMVEIKLSQGAKPGHGGVLLGAKVTSEIAAARGVPVGVDCISPPAHSAFGTPLELMRFIGELRALSGGKPVGFKLCIGLEWEFIALGKAMLESGIRPDFIVVDGGEGGTGAAPPEFMDHVGMPLRDGLLFAHNALVGMNLRKDIRLAASGRIASAFDIARAIVLGADWCNSGRGFMFAVGCIQAQNCHTGLCPVGVATQDPARQRALVIADKAERVFHLHRGTLGTLGELVAAVGLDHPGQLRPHHFSRRVGPDRVETYDRLYKFLEPGELLAGTDDPLFRTAWSTARADSFAPVQT
ncbi:MAG: FMN-binding glutamate synthase family protein [Rhodospirillaceae bacterium]